MDGVDPQQFAVVDEKGFVPDDVRNAFFRKLRMKNDNRSCFECPTRNPTWISLSYGVYLCLECSGEHRRKGVHLSFVRSVELDRFSPDQMVQMALGGNAKAWAHFKTHEMGKTCSGGRAIDYNSKVAQRYKQQLESDTKDECRKLNVACKGVTQAPVAKADPIDEATDFAFAGPPSAGNVTTAKSAPAVVKSSPAAPAPVFTPKAAATAPASVVLRKSTAEVVAPPSPAAAAAAAVKPSGFAGSKHLAKEIEFDFDFDELEHEASKPAPPPPPAASSAPVASPAKPTPAPMLAPARAQSASEAETVAKFANKKGISSDDFFGELESETASGRMEREARYNKFSGSAAISSSSFFGDGEPEETGDKRFSSGDSDDWKTSAAFAAGRGAEYAKAGISKGAELLTTYLSKVRD